MDARTLIHRWHSPVLFGLIGLCFLLPFATVSCEGAETTFTGAQLATWSVPEGRTMDGADLSAQVENDASGLALVTLAAAALGLLLGVAGVRGGGWCAAIGLTTAILAARNAFTLFGPDVTFHEGYTFTVLLFLWAWVLHGARAWRRLRRGRAHVPAPGHQPGPTEGSSSPRRSDPYWSAQLAQWRSPRPRSGATH
jgi:hypothetical protein